MTEPTGPHLPGFPDRVVLTGFMGSGKSTVGRILARSVWWRFLDVDREIEHAAGTTIADIFRLHGEAHFRQLEHETIARLLNDSRVVLSLGGGAIEDERTRALLLNDPATRLVHLEASFDTVLLRTSGTDAIRPVLADRANLEARYLRRLPLYRLAHLTLPVDNLTPRAAAQALAARLQLTPPC